MGDFDTFLNALARIFVIVSLLNSMKHTIGFKFPWEVCGCCGKKWKEHS